MQVISADLITGKRVVLRADIDVPIENGLVIDDFRLKAGLETLKLCLGNAQSVVMMGHVGRPQGKDQSLSVAPIYGWLVGQGFKDDLDSGKLKLLENLRFEPGEESSDPDYAKQLAEYGDYFVNEAFAAYRPAASTTVLPSLLPHGAGLRFAKEVEKLTQVRNNPQKPYVAIMGGAKVEDKLPVIKVLAEKADAVLVGGKLASEITIHGTVVQGNVMVGKLNEKKTDMAEETIESWKNLINGAKQIIWNGPVGKVEEQGSRKGTDDLARIILDSEAEVIIGGGDTIGFLQSSGLLEKFEQKGFVSTGGGAMLKFLVDGTLPTIQALE